MANSLYLKNPIVPNLEIIEMLKSKTTNFYQLQRLANFYGFDLEDISDRPPYNNRKSETIGLSDRRTGKIVCVYALKNLSKIHEFLSDLHS